DRPRLVRHCTRNSGAPSSTSSTCKGVSGGTDRHAKAQSRRLPGRFAGRRGGADPPRTRGARGDLRAGREGVVLRAQPGRGPIQGDDSVREIGPDPRERVRAQPSV
ncbi:MAG: hypothetical protein AVDCRST_MAG68-1012, partial [uncultured Gemmatimonadetes bacterium]